MNFDFSVSKEDINFAHLLICYWSAYLPNHLVWPYDKSMKFVLENASSLLRDMPNAFFDLSGAKDDQAD